MLRSAYALFAVQRQQGLSSTEASILRVSCRIKSGAHPMRDDIEFTFVMHRIIPFFIEEERHRNEVLYASKES